MDMKFGYMASGPVFFSDSFRSAVDFEGESDGGSDLSEVADHK